jgi:hypothetical protein
VILGGLNLQTARGGQPHDIEKIWTATVHRLLYARVVKLFGAYDKWEKKTSPGRGLDADYTAFCEAFAKVVGANSGEAVKHQIAFALPSTSNGSTWSRDHHAQVAILNKAAALEEGFIANKHLPDLLAVGREAAE